MKTKELQATKLRLLISLFRNFVISQIRTSPFNPESTGLFSPGAALGGGVFHPLRKIRSRHPRKLKLTGLIAYIKFYKLRKFESSTIINDVIMTSLPKTMGKFGVLH